MKGSQRIWDTAEALLALHVGAAVQGFMLPYNLGRFGNGIALWLGIQPYGEPYSQLFAMQLGSTVPYKYICVI